MNIIKNSFDIASVPITMIPVPVSFHVMMSTRYAIYGKLDTAVSTLCIVYLSGEVVKIDLSDECASIDGIDIYTDSRQLEVITDQSTLRFQISNDEKILSNSPHCVIIPHESVKLCRHFIIDDSSTTLNGINFRDPSAVGDIIGSTFFNTDDGSSYIILATDKNTIEVYDVSTNEPFLTVIHQYPNVFDPTTYKGMIIIGGTIISIFGDAVIVSGMTDPEVFNYKLIDVEKYGELRSVSFVPNEVLYRNSVMYVFDDMLILTERGIIYRDLFLHMPNSSLTSVGDRHCLLIESELL